MSCQAPQDSYRPWLPVCGAPSVTTQKQVAWCFVGETVVPREVIRDVCEAHRQSVFAKVKQPACPEPWRLRWYKRPKGERTW